MRATENKPKPMDVRVEVKLRKQKDTERQVVSALALEGQPVSRGTLGSRKSKKVHHG